MEGDFQECGHCKRSVASAHFALHEAHCLRFLELCPECEEPVPGPKMAEHLKEHQQPEECLEQPDKHLEQPVECKFCELAVHLSKLQTHEHHCGARTERCPDCGRFVMLRELAQHRDVCGGTQASGLRKGENISAPERKICCDYCGQMIPEDNSFHHLGKCGPVTKPKSRPPSLPRPAAESPSSKAKKDVRPKSKQFNGFPRTSESSTKQAARGKTRSMDLPWKSKLEPRAGPTSAGEVAYDILRQCSQCSILLPLPTLIHHQVPRLCPLLTRHEAAKTRWVFTAWQPQRALPRPLHISVCSPGADHLLDVHQLPEMGLPQGRATSLVSVPPAS